MGKTGYTTIIRGKKYYMEWDNNDEGEETEAAFDAMKLDRDEWKAKALEAQRKLKAE